jgi:predicted regulator of Ras-like GTPase activity (Roadblock/LC7/MglB family)
MQHRDLAIETTAYERMAMLCHHFLRESDATCVIIVGMDGTALHRQGFLEDLDIDSLCALAAATFASTGEIAKIIGEQQFDFFMQEGQQNHVQMVRVGDVALLVAIFDNRTTAGMVRLRAQQAAPVLASLLQ